MKYSFGQMVVDFLAIIVLTISFFDVEYPFQKFVVLAAIIYIWISAFFHYRRTRR